MRTVGVPSLDPPGHSGGQAWPNMTAGWPRPTHSLPPLPSRRHLLRHCARDDVGLGGEIYLWHAVADVGAQVDERDGDAEPHDEQGEEGAKGDGARRLLSPDEHIEREENEEDDP
eukprot:scaffold19009_cov98-Isochrysis_galbana.AAC.8